MRDLDEFLSPENRKIHEEQLRIAANKRAKAARGGPDRFFESDAHSALVNLNRASGIKPEPISWLW